MNQLRLYCVASRVERVAQHRNDIPKDIAHASFVVVAILDAKLSRT